MIPKRAAVVSDISEALSVDDHGVVLRLRRWKNDYLCYLV